MEIVQKKDNRDIQLDFKKSKDYATNERLKLKGSKVILIKGSDKLKVSKLIRTFKAMTTASLPSGSKWCSLYQLALLNPECFIIDWNLACVSTFAQDGDEAMLWLGIVPTPWKEITEYSLGLKMSCQLTHDYKITLEVYGGAVHVVVTSEEKKKALIGVNTVKKLISGNDPSITSLSGK